MKAHNALILSMIFFGISIMIMFSHTFYGQETPETHKWFYESNLHHNLMIDNAPLMTFNLFDYYYSYIENYIILLSMAIGAGLFLGIIKTVVMEKYKYNEKQNSIGEKNATKEKRKQAKK